MEYLPTPSCPIPLFSIGTPWKLHRILWDTDISFMTKYTKAWYYYTSHLNSMVKYLEGSLKAFPVIANLGIRAYYLVNQLLQKFSNLSRTRDLSRAFSTFFFAPLSALEATQRRLTKAENLYLHMSLTWALLMKCVHLLTVQLWCILM